jgi:hypothetical protein
MSSLSSIAALDPRPLHSSVTRPLRHATALPFVAPSTSPPYPLSPHPRHRPTLCRPIHVTALPFVAPSTSPPYSFSPTPHHHSGTPPQPNTTRLNSPTHPRLPNHQIRRRLRPRRHPSSSSQVCGVTISLLGNPVRSRMKSPNHSGTRPVPHPGGACLGRGICPSGPIGPD